MAWMDDLGKILKKGIMKDGDTPNWVGMAVTGALAGGAALLTSGASLPMMIISTLLAAGAGLFIGSAVAGNGIDSGSGLGGSLASLPDPQQISYANQNDLTNDISRAVSKAKGGALTDAQVLTATHTQETKLLSLFENAAQKIRSKELTTPQAASATQLFSHKEAAFKNLKISHNGEPETDLTHDFNVIASQYAENTDAFHKRPLAERVGMLHCKLDSDIETHYKAIEDKLGWSSISDYTQINYFATNQMIYKIKHDAQQALTALSKGKIDTFMSESNDALSCHYSVGYLGGSSDNVNEIAQSLKQLRDAVAKKSALTKWSSETQLAAVSALSENGTMRLALTQTPGDASADTIVNAPANAVVNNPAETFTPPAANAAPQTPTAPIPVSQDIVNALKNATQPAPAPTQPTSDDISAVQLGGLSSPTATLPPTAANNALTANTPPAAAR